MIKVGRRGGQKKKIMYKAHELDKKRDQRELVHSLFKFGYKWEPDVSIWTPQHTDKNLKKTIKEII